MINTSKLRFKTRRFIRCEKWVRTATDRSCIDGIILEECIYHHNLTEWREMGKPTVVYGGGLSEAQIQQTSQLLSIKDPNTVLTEQHR